MSSAPPPAVAAEPDPARIQRYAELGVERVVLFLPSAPAEVVLPILDHYAALMRS